MEDVIRVKDQFYVLATSSLADDRTRVLKHGDMFAVFNRFGDIEWLGLGEHGIYHEGTRYLSRFVLRLGESSPQLLRSTIRGDNAFLTVDMTNLDITEGGHVVVPRGTLHLFRSQFLRNSVCYKHLRLSNYSLHRVESSITCEFDADFADIFEVRGTKRENHGRTIPPQMDPESVMLRYAGRDGRLRQTRMIFSPPPQQLTEQKARFWLSLEPKEEASIYVTICCQCDARQRKVLSFEKALAKTTEALEHGALRRTWITTSNPRFNAWLTRSEADLHMMIEGNPEGPYPYAGVPWFNTVFGRDGILTAMECLWLAPWMARSVLKYLAETQATEVIPEEEAEPGKILHEMRRGEMAALREVPFGLYYGSIDATPLFVMLAGAYLERTDDRAFLQSIWPNVLAALDWIDRYGDADQDGFVEYQAKGRKGLVHQGWKDSHDSISHADGSLAEPPIALCEVQAYVFAAKRAAARLAHEFGQQDLARNLVKESEELQQKFESVFWSDDLNTYVLALDGEKRPCRVQASNAGHCLFAEIVSQEHAQQLASRLMGDELFCGWGVRTLGSNEVRYNPMSYHNGSVWPHDNAIIARGLARYGFKKEALAVVDGLFEAGAFMELHRLPELFCGFHRRSGSEGPTLYPVACSPQAWAAGSIYLLLDACLGIAVNAKEKCIRFNSPFLPDYLDELRIENLLVGDATIDIVTQHKSGRLGIEILRQKGEVEVQCLK